jgi:hypothetical protein
VVVTAVVVTAAVVTAVVVTAVVVTAVVVTAAVVVASTGPQCRRDAPASGGQPHSGRRTVSARLRGCLEACGRL